MIFLSTILVFLSMICILQTNQMTEKYSRALCYQKTTLNQPEKLQMAVLRAVLMAVLMIWEEKRQSMRQKNMKTIWRKGANAE